MAPRAATAASSASSDRLACICIAETVCCKSCFAISVMAIAACICLMVQFVLLWMSYAPLTALEMPGFEGGLLFARRVLETNEVPQNGLGVSIRVAS